jgi:multidrug resistance efflux pump
MSVPSARQHQLSKTPPWLVSPSREEGIVDNTPPISPAERPNPLSGNVVRLKPNKRFADRLEYGLTASWKNVRLEIANWSLGGIGVIYPHCPWQTGQEIKLLLHIPLSECHFPLTVKATFNHENSENHYVGLQFSNVEAATMAALTYVFRQRTRGEDVTLAGLLAAYHQRSHSAASAEEQSAQAAFPAYTPVVQRVKRGGVYVAVLLMAMVMLYGLASTVNRYWFQIDASYAALTAPAYTVKAPSNGFVDVLFAENGDAPVLVKKGQPLLRLTDPSLDTQLAALDAQITLQHDKVAILQHRLQTEQTLFSYYQQLAGSEQKAATADVTAAETAVRLAQKEEKRLQSLHRKGLTTASAYEKAALMLAQAKTTLNNAVAAREQAQTNRAMAGKSFYYTGQRVEGGTPQATLTEIAEARAETKSLQQRQAALRKQQQTLTLNSPCDCVLGERQVNSQTWVKAGQPLLLLHRQDAVGLHLEATIPQQEASRLRTGNPASVLFVNQPQALRGVVQNIQRLPAREPRHGLPAEAKRDEWATVQIALQEALPRTAAVGLPAEVSFDVSYRNPIIQAFGALKQWSARTNDMMKKIAHQLWASWSSL